MAQSASSPTDMDEGQKGTVRKWAGLVLDSTWQDTRLDRKLTVTESKVRTETIDGYSTKQISVVYDTGGERPGLESAGDMLTKVEAGVYRPLTGCEDAMKFVEEELSDDE